VVCLVGGWLESHVTQDVTGSSSPFPLLPNTQKPRVAAIMSASVHGLYTPSVPGTP
jgi:hypothetical protein